MHKTSPDSLHVWSDVDEIIFESVVGVHGDLFLTGGQKNVFLKIPDICADKASDVTDGSWELSQANIKEKSTYMGSSQRLNRLKTSSLHLIV